ncbi:MAG: hypothetical protein NE327_19140 [Lentisphaeraceae bacterium]|nr:hypothetical protein [Lentisphaeraceae bacterium]
MNVKHKLYADYYGSGVILGWSIVTALIPYGSLKYLFYSDWKEYSDIPVEIPIAATIIGAIAFLVLIHQISTRPVEGFATQKGVLLKYLFRKKLIPWSEFKSFDYAKVRFETRISNRRHTALKWVVKLFYLNDDKEYMQFTVKSEDHAIRTCLLLEDIVKENEYNEQKMIKI